MRIVIIPRNENGQYTDPTGPQDYDLIEVENSETKISTNKTIVEADSADDYATEQGWNKNHDGVPEPPEPE